MLASGLLTAATVAVAFAALSLQLRGHTRRLLAQTLAQHQRVLADVQKRGLADILRASTLMSASPTLRAAMETYRGEAVESSAPRAEILATIQAETETIAGGLGRDLLIVTDLEGRVLAASGRPEDLPPVGADLSAHAVIRHALAQESPVGPGNFSVLRVRKRDFQVGCVPILLQDFIIGTLTLGDRIDREFAGRVRATFGSDVVVTAGGRVLASTLPDAGARPGVPEGLASGRDVSPGGTSVVRLGPEEFVAAALTLGTDEDGNPVTVHLLRSLTRALAGSNRSLLLTLCLYGALVVVAVGLSASVASRSLLRPLEQLVAFMRSAYDAAGRGGRFEAPGAGAEVRVLGETFNRLMQSLRAHEERLVQKAREDLERLERLKESEKLAALGRMLSGAAHEINNPLTAVIGNIELLLEKGGLAGEPRQRLEEIGRQGRRIVALTRNLLKVARRDGGGRGPVEVNQILRDTLELRRRDFERAGITLQVELSPEPVRLLASELELQQVFLNIVNNAYDALAGTKGRRLTVRTADAPDRATITFADNGPGLADPARVFDHFYTTKPPGQGTGLGLGISQTIVRNHGGEITAENPPEGGARFTITLPRAARPPEEAPGPAVEADRAPASRRHLPASILVVDDEPMILELQVAILDSIGARPVAARSGAEAIEHLRRRDFDLIVSDLGLPGEVSGKALFDWVAANRRRGTRGFVFVSGAAAGEAALPNDGEARLVHKPFSMEEYVSALRETWDAEQPAA